MGRNYVALAAVLLLLSPVASLAQSPAAVSVPRLINVTGSFQPTNGEPPPSAIDVTLSIYADQDGGTPLWQESQRVALDKSGKFTVLLGATQADGISPEVFASRDGLWLGMQVAGSGEVERPRVRLASVPYALRAADADTLGGRPASAYLLAPTEGGAASANVTGTTSGSSADIIVSGTPGFLAKYTSATDVGNSAIFETSGLAGIGTVVPLDVLHVQFTNTNGGMTGYAVQNMGSSPTSYSGMLFYDQTGALGQFQGFNNSTHEYRINNIGRVSPGGAFNGSINFMIGSTSRFFVGSNGFIGIGTTAPFSNLELSNGLTGTTNALLTASTYNATGVGSQFTGRHARGTSSAPTALLANDSLAGFGGRGYGATAFGPGISGMGVRAAENWTDTAQGTYLQFFTTNMGTTATAPRMTLDANGQLGLGAFPTSAVDIARQGTSEVRNTSFDGESVFIARTARGTQQAPTQIVTDDFLGGFGAAGYGTTGFGDVTAAVAAFAAENFTDTAQGTAMAFFSTPIGTNEPQANMVVMPNGNVGIGTFLDETLPTIPEKLVVFGDARVGTAGTNGCLKNFAGTGIAGACSSDRRLKKDITPFAPVLNQVAALQPVHYYWRAAEFPDRHFGTSRTYGLVAQDVEQVLPELVVTNDDGFKAVDYSELPLLTIQAIKELKAENDALKQRVTETEALKQRVAELERLVTELLATGRR